ncbi:DoxX family protein [Vibrio fortis]|nr:DoxX family protein [Vibrio fortis]|tara:strand:- start:529 stop:915 length:387 start_codon:yes stop_codon:yes gene_type:complete
MSKVGSIMNVVSIVLIVFFMLASSIKTLGWQKKVFETQLAFFKNYGLNRQIMFVVGCLELTGAMSLLLGLVGWVPELVVSLGALLLAVVSIGAIFFHLRFDSWQAGIPAMVTLSLSSYVAYPLIALLH